MGKMVKCINNDGFESDLLIGASYEVLETKMYGPQENYRMYHSSGSRAWYSAQRFEEVDQEEATVPTLRVPVFSNQPVACDSVPSTEKPAAVTYVTSKTSSDNQDWKFFAKPQEGDCVCGVPRDACKYHK